MKKSICYIVTILFASICITSYANSEKNSSTSFEYDEYELFKKNIKESGTSINEIISELLYYPYNNQTDFDTQDTPEKGFYYYNFAREFYGEKMASSLNEIDKSWIEKISYNNFKEKMLAKFENKQFISQNKRINYLLFYMNSCLEKQNYTIYNIYKNPEPCGSLNTLFSYNFARELQNQTQTKSLENIDNQWINNNYGSYEYFKDETTKEWDEKEITENKIYHLLEHVFYHMFQQFAIKQNDSYHQKIALFNYNFARELIGKPLIQLYAKIDSKWLEKYSYNHFKKTVFALNFMENPEWENKHPIFIARFIQILLRVLIYESDIKNNTCQKNALQRHALFLYNTIRELLGESITQSLDEIDKTWLENILIEIGSYMEDEAYNASVAQTELLKKAQADCDLLDNDIKILVRSQGAMAKKEEAGHTVYLDPTEDLDYSLFSIYHELSHIKNFEIIYSEPISPDDLIAKLNIEKDLENLNIYTQKARKKIDTSTETGKKIISSISGIDNFWIPPANPQERSYITLGRWEESQADLFAVDKLLTQNKLSSVLKIIQDWGMSDSIVVEKDNNDVHPSMVERALYMAGYLISKGFDINKELKTWENTGVCVDIESLYQTYSPVSQDSLQKKQTSKYFSEYFQKKTANKFYDEA